MIVIADESIRHHGAGAYVVATASVARPAEGYVRRHLLRLEAGKAGFHWIRESERERRRILDLIAECDVQAHAWICTPVASSHHETARAKCLREALTITGRSLTTLLIDTRESHLNHN